MRTGTVSYKVDDLRKSIIIPIGFVGENDFTRVIFDAEEIYKNYPAAQVSMKVQPPKGGIYPATVTKDGNNVIWQVKAADVAHRGSGELQMTFTEGDTVIKTYIARTDIKRSLVGNGPAPDPVQDWLDEAQEALEDIESAEVHQPIIGNDGYWYRWDAEAGEYVTTGTKAQGQDGHSPVLTSSKSGKTTTLYADGEQIAQIQDGEDGQGADVIDDTAGEGDTNKTWSADKLAEETGQLLTAIQGITPNAQQSDIGKALILKTIDQSGKPTEFEYGEAGGGLSNEAIQALLACFAHVAWIDDAGPIYYDALQDALDTGTKTLVSISAVYTQGIVYPEDSLDTLKSRLVVTGTYDDTSTATITEYTLSGALAIGTSTITVTVDNITTTFTVDVYGFKPMRCETMRGTVGSNAYTSENTSRVLNLCDVGTHKLKDDHGTLMNFYPVPIRSGVSVLKVSVGSDLDTTIQIVQWDATMNDWKRIMGTDWGYKPSQYSLSSYNDGTYAAAIIGAKDSGTPGLPDNTYNFTNHVFSDYDIHFE